MIFLKSIVNIHQQQWNKRNVKWCPSRNAKMFLRIFELDVMHFVKVLNQTPHKKEGGEVANNKILKTLLRLPNLEERQMQKGCRQPREMGNAQNSKSSTFTTSLSTRQEKQILPCWFFCQENSSKGHRP